MRKFLICLVSGVAFGLVPEPARSQPPTPATNDSADHALQLETSRAGLIDPEARPAERRRWAELVFSYRFAEATNLMAELLQPGGNPDVQRALASVIATRGHESPDRLDPALVAPLIALLGAAAEDLRALAARALANFPGPKVPASLAALAGDAATPLPNRLAAVDALAPNTHRRDVVGHLVTLLDTGVAAITERVLVALGPLAPEALGEDVQKWRGWWQAEAQLSEEAWLAERSVIYRDRLRRTEEELHRFREDAQRNRAALVEKMRGMQRELFRALPADQRDAKLTAWLGDAHPVVQQTALLLIKARMADEGKRPAGKLLDGLLALLKNAAPELRREVLEIVQNVGGPAVVGAVLAQLDQAESESTRHAIFQALGRLNSVDAIPAMIREIARSDSPNDCVREAALSLGKVITRTDNAEWRSQAVAALKHRSAPAVPDDVPLRAALLSAMAGIADPVFLDDFLSAVDSEAPTILREAVRGLRALGDTSKLPRIRALMAHPEPLVRLEAIGTVAQLGHEDADLERLLTRLDPATESNDLAREAAWTGVQRLLSAEVPAERIKAAERLRELPDLKIKYLEELVDGFATSGASADDIAMVLDRLTMALVSQGRHAEAVAYLKALHESRIAAGHADAFDVGLRLLESTLRGGAPLAAADLIRQLAEGADEPSKGRVVDVVAEYLSVPAGTNGSDGREAVRVELLKLPATLLPEPWVSILSDSASTPVDSVTPSDSPAPTE